MITTMRTEKNKMHTLTTGGTTFFLLAESEHDSEEEVVSNFCSINSSLDSVFSSCLTSVPS